MRCNPITPKLAQMNYTYYGNNLIVRHHQHNFNTIVSED